MDMDDVKIGITRMNALTLNVVLIGLLLGGSAWAADSNPNIIVIYADDMGVGDVSGLNPEGKIPTPHIDRMIDNGLALLNGHTTSSVCTPSRYGLLTGRYNWRSRRKAGVAGGFTKSEIEKGRTTLATLLKKAGYHTGMIGKWHLGLDWVKLPDTGTKKSTEKKKKKAPDIDYTKPFRGGPIDHGFDSWFGIAASLDMPPYVWLVDDRASERPTVTKAFHRPGPAAESFEAIDVLPRLGVESVAYIKRQAADAKKGRPFFLYVPLTSPHTPILPSPEWQGKSKIGTDYADFTMQTDGIVGQILDALRETGLEENTIVVFSADNGCSPAAGFGQHLAKGHNPSAMYRGHKADLYEGGHRVPLVIQWPAGAPAGRKSDQLISLADLLATFADLTGQKLADHEGEDSISFLELLEGRSEKSARQRAIYHTINGKLAITEGDWKLIVAKGSGGWTPAGARYQLTKKSKKQPRAHEAEMGLYHLADDVGEYHNLFEQHPEVATRLMDRLKNDVARGRSTPGETQENDGNVRIFGVWKDR